MEKLGWVVGKSNAGYRLKLPRLSDEETELVLAVSERFRQESERRAIGGEGEAKERIVQLLSDECEKEGIELDSEQKGYLPKVCLLHTFGAGFIDTLTSDPSLEEIAVVGIGQPVFVYVRGKGWRKTNVSIESQEYFVSCVNRLARSLGRRITSQRPRINAVLEDGSRLHASMPPVSPCELTIRKFSSEPFSPMTLLSKGTYDAKMLSLLSLVFQADFTCLFAGNTASGKTTTLNALLSFIPSSERVLLIEETPEISIPHPHQVRLLPFEEGDISMVDLVRDSLRMRPDRVVVGEVRAPGESKAFLESSLSGQAKGCYSTFHALTSRDAMLRLRMMGCAETDLEGISFIVVQRRRSSYDVKGRKVAEERVLTELSYCDRADVMQPVKIYDSGKYSPSALSRALSSVANSLSISKREASAELERRRKFLSASKDASFGSAFASIQKFLYGGEKPG